jgi:hypothetical protein
MVFNELNDLVKTIKNLNLDSILSKKTLMKSVTIYSNLTTSGLKDKSGASKKHGVYIHYYNGNPLYVGKAERQSISIRQSQHLGAFRNPKSIAERSGKKYRDFLNENKLESMKIDIWYLDLSDYPKCIIPMLELEIMDYLNTPFNKENQNS